MTNNTNIIKFGILILTFVLLSSLAYGFGIGAPYWKDNPLKIAPGETRDIQFDLSNGGGATENISAKVSLTNGSEIVSLIDSSDIYDVPAGGKVFFNLRVSIPASAKVGDTYDVTLSVSTISKSEKGSFMFGSSVEQSFQVIIVGKSATSTTTQTTTTEKTSQAYIYVAIGIIILLIIIFFVIIRRKR